MTFEDVKHDMRVQHTEWRDSNDQPQKGTVKLFPDAEPGTARGEIRWDDCFVADELDLVLDKLVPAAA